VDIPFKVLLLLDNAPGQSPCISDIDDNINIMFLLSNTTSLIQPMDQSAITNLTVVIFGIHSSNWLRTQLMAKTNFL
jgi:hypothetical protein